MSKLSAVGGVPGGAVIRDALEVAHNGDGTVQPVIVGVTTSLSVGATQPTTAVASATIVNGSGTAGLQDDTYDGYTVAKVVKALRTLGILA